MSTPNWFREHGLKILVTSVIGVLAWAGRTAEERLHERLNKLELNGERVIRLESESHHIRERLDEIAERVKDIQRRTK
jgi:hypothetical protein